MDKEQLIRSIVKKIPAGNVFLTTERRRQIATAILEDMEIPQKLMDLIPEGEYCNKWNEYACPLCRADAFYGSHFTVLHQGVQLLEIMEDGHRRFVKCKECYKPYRQGNGT